MNEEVVDVNDVAGMGDDDIEVPFPEVEGDGAYNEFEQDYNEWLDNQEQPSNGEISLDIEEPLDDNGEYIDDLDPSLVDIGEVPYESINRIVKRITEAVLNDFGKHPAYQKKPMTTPPNKEIDKFGKDWNDDSAKGEKPFGTQIGDSAPFTDEVIDKLTDAIMKRIDGDKKKD